MQAPEIVGPPEPGQGGEHEFEVPLAGPSGEPVNLWRTFISHGLAELPPLALDPDRRSLLATLPAGAGRPRMVEISSTATGMARLRIRGRIPGKDAAGDLLATVRHILRLDEDLAPFYDLIRDDPELSWAAAGAGRLVRSPTVFEDVVKTICTTNCAWSATERMIGALCQHLGEPAHGAPSNSPLGRAFPTPQAMAEAGEEFYRSVVRAGYRSSYLMSIATSVAEGRLDLEVLGRATPEELPDDELAERLLALPGVGPYAAAHVMLILGRYSRLVLDSWTRPKYAQLTGRAKVKDTTIERRFRRYGRYKGLAFWLFLTRDWADDGGAAGDSH